MIYKLKNEGSIIGYAVVPDHELPDEEAEFDPHTKLLKLREGTFYAANNLYNSPKKPRARFTIAHEVGHMLRCHKRIRHRSISDKKIEKIVFQTRIDEIEASRFAGALLMPRHLIDLSLNPTPAEISFQFLVSEVAASIRLDQLERLMRRRSGLKRPLPESVREYLIEARSRGFKINSLDEE